MKKLLQAIEKYQNGEIDRDHFKHDHVRWGSYEQRTNGLYMVRTRMPGGRISAYQLKKLAGIAHSSGSGRLHISTRQEFQIHDIPLEYLFDAISKIDETGLSSFGGGGNTVRNVVVSEFAGLSEKTSFDITPYADALSQRFMKEPESINLPRKFKIGFFYENELLSAQSQDLGFVLKKNGDQIGFSVYAGGGLGRNPATGILLENFIAADDVYAIAKAVRVLFSQYGDRTNRNEARLRYVLRKFGENEFRNKYKKILSELNKEENIPLDVKFAQNKINDYHTSFIIPISGGDIQSDTVLKLADMMVGLGEDVIRLTQDQNLRVRNITLDESTHLRAEIDKLFPRVLSYATACSGADTCRLGVTESRTLLNKINDYLDDDQKKSDLRIRISGCPNSCGNHHTADIGLCGFKKRIEGEVVVCYSVFVKEKDGLSLGKTVGDIKEKDVPLFIAKTLQTKQYQESKWINHIEALLKPFHGA